MVSVQKWNEIVSKCEFFVVLLSQTFDFLLKRQRHIPQGFGGSKEDIISHNKPFNQNKTKINAL